VSGPSRIQRILGLARRKEEETERALAARRREVDEATDAVDLARARAVEDLTPTEGTNVEDFLLRRRMSELRAQALRDREAERRAAEDAVLRARQEWLEAARYKRTVDRLDERDRAARAVVAARASQRTLDEVALRRLRGQA
jgi:flagellar export protein FliJ